MNIINISSLRHLLQVLATTPIDRILKPEEVYHILKLCGCIFMHPGVTRPDIPHPKLRSGRCSNAFCNLGMALAFNSVRRLLGYQLAMLMETKHDLESIDWIVSSDHSGAPILYAAADYIGNINPNLKADFCTKEESDPKNKLQLWQRHKIKEGAVVAHFEELATSGGATVAVRKGIRAEHLYEINFLPHVPTIVKRESKEHNFTEGTFLSLTDLPGAEEYEANRCPLCATGSKNEGFKAHWDTIVGTAMMV